MIPIEILVGHLPVWRSKSMNHSHGAEIQEFSRYSGLLGGDDDAAAGVSLFADDLKKVFSEDLAAGAFTNVL